MERLAKNALLLLLFVFAAVTASTCMGSLRALGEELRPVVRNPAVCPAGEIAVVGLREPVTLLPDDVLDISGHVDAVLLGLEWIYVTPDGAPIGEWQSNMLKPCLVEAADA